MDAPGVIAVFAAALVTALATGLGAVPFLFVAHLAVPGSGLPAPLRRGS